VLVETSERMLSKKNKSKKIICIDPCFYGWNEDLSYNLKVLDRKKTTLKRDILRSGKKNKIELQVVDLNQNSPPEYYEDLLKLKKNILEANYSQTTALNFSNTARYNSVQKRVFVYPPRISHEFASFSKTYGTPYFSYIGLYQSNSRLVLYHVLVDTDAAETVYREYKLINGTPSASVLSQLVHDSYALLARELNKK